MEKKAKALVGKLAKEVGETPDDPVMEYLAGLLVVATEDASEEDGLKEMLSQFLPSLPNIDASLQSMLSDLKVVDEVGETDDPFSGSVQEDVETGEDTLGHSVGENATGLDDLSTSVASARLNAEAKEFVPKFLEHCPGEDSGIEQCPAMDSSPDGEGHEMEMDEEFWYEQDDAPPWLSGESSVDSLGILMCLFPAFSQNALQDLLLTNSGNLQKCIQILYQIDSQSQMDSHLTERQDSTRLPKVVDMSEASFPSLAVTKGASSQKSTWNKSANKGNFVAAAKKGVDCKGQLFSGVGKDGKKKNVQWERKGKVIPWVSTGEEVSQQYAKAREEAREFALMRNSCFEQATRAYLSGKKALAKELGAKGRWYCDKMKECHAHAAEGIFMERNHRFRQSSGSQPGIMIIDLHGLHVREARRILKRELQDLLQQGNKYKIASLLVGTGHHTKGSRTPSRLPGAVQEFLDEEGYSHQTRDAGVIDVKL